MRIPDAATALAMIPPPPNSLETLSTIARVTASDMIPFVPCQPLAMALGATWGIWAFPIYVIGQTLAGALAFQFARVAPDSIQVQEVLDSLGEKSKDKV